jgi:hypothetical protein
MENIMTNDYGSSDNSAGDQLKDFKERTKGAKDGIVLWFIDWAPPAEDALNHTEEFIAPQPTLVRHMRRKPEE